MEAFTNILKERLKKEGDMTGVSIGTDVHVNSWSGQWGLSL